MYPALNHKRWLGWCYSKGSAKRIRGFPFYTWVNGCPWRLGARWLVLQWFVESDVTSWGSSLIGSFKVIHHYALIGLTEPCLQLIWLVDDCKRRWHLSASCYLEIQTPSCFPGRSSLLSFLLFSSSRFKVLNASAFRDFVGMCTIIPLKILTTKTKYMPCDVIFLFHLMVKL